MHVRLPIVDAMLQRDRIDSSGDKVTFEAKLSDLPDGVMVLPGPEGAPHLVESGRLRSWSLTGYGEPAGGPAEVTVLTPRSVVRTFASGFKPAF